MIIDVQVDRWSKSACCQLYVCTLEVEVSQNVTDAFDFSWTAFGQIMAVVDDFGNLVALTAKQCGWLRLYWNVVELEATDFERRYPKERDHVAP